jgi:hypothetical protein
MENARIWQIFQTLAPLERKHLGQWLRSPFFCRREQPLLLFEYFQQCKDGGESPDQAAAFRKIFGAGKSLNIQALRQVMSELSAQIEHFLVYREKFDAREGYHIALASAYRRRGLEKHFRQSLHAARVDWDQQPCRHTEYFDAQVALEFELYRHLSAGRRTEALNMQQLSDQTDVAFIARKLRLACFALSHQSVYNTDYRFGLLEMLLEHVRNMPALQQIPAVGLYYFCYLSLTDAEGERYFIQFKTMLFACTDQLPVDEQRNLHLLAINFCIRRINQLESRYSREAYELYKSALQANLLLENNQLSHFAYNNIAAIALKVGETEWAGHFIREYAPTLEKKHRNAAFHLNMARVEYGRQNLKSALLHLQEADYKDLINNLIAKSLQLKIYYETGEFDALDAHLQSMQTFIRRQRVIGYHKTNFLNIIRYTRRLMQLHPADKQEKEVLQRQIEAEPVLTEKEWLLEQMA